jgi:class 3 adenylate cyclase/tetratricopeptide (TPR) repeat protein/DNA polymerase III delta prime subunit
VATETVTLLFSDLVASTELLSRVGEAAAEELRREHFALLRAVIAETGGREVKNLGDGLMVAFDGVSAALSCGVAMQQAITARPPSVEPLAIRIGISVGEAESEDGDYFGLPVVEAARLCAAAGGGEVLCSEMVRMLARSRGGFDLESVGPLELKGLDEPVATYRVRWEPRAAADQPPLPSRLTAALSGEFVGRGQEHQRLSAAWKAVVGGERRVLLLAGEPGIGKTTLAARLAAEVHDQGAVVLYGRCDEDLGVPYQPWIESLGQLVGHLPDEVLAAHVADRGAHLARVVPELGLRSGAEAPATADGDAERFVLFGCVTDLLDRAARVGPLLIVLDDLHWADRPTTQLLRHLVTNLSDVPIALVGTFRDSDVASGDPAAELLAVLHREHGVERLALSGLSDLDLSTLLERIAGHELDEDGVALRDAVLAETAGNPFFVGEVLRHLAESGALVHDSTGRWVAATDLSAVGLPVSVREVVGQRVGRLGPEAERLLTLASVIGRDFDIGLLAAVADIDEDLVIDCCDAAVAAAVLRETDQPDRYTFTHALIEHTLYDSLSGARRTRAHHAVAEAIEVAVGADPGSRAGELAHHWTQATAPTDAGKAARYAQLAGDRALDQLAPDEALRWYGQALDLLGPADSSSRMRLEILIGLGEAQRQAGVAEYRETLLEVSRLADANDLVDLLVRAVLANNRGMLSMNLAVDDERIAMIDRALERIGDADSAERARLLSLACLERIYGGGFEDRLRLAEQAVAAARACGDPDVLVTTNVFCADGIFSPATADLRRAWIDEVAPLADSLTNPATRYLLHNRARYSAVEWADTATARASDAPAREALARVPQASLQWNNAFHQVWPEILWGDLEEAERLADEALTLGLQSGEPDAMSIFGADIMVIRDFQGRLRELIPLIEQARAETPEAPTFRGILALAFASSGRETDAMELLDAEAAACFETSRDYNWTTTQSVWAEAAARTGHSVAAEFVYEQLRPFDDLIVSASAVMRLAVAHYLGLLDHSLGRLDDADERFAKAMEVHERLGSGMFVAHTQAAWAALLADRDRGDDRERAVAMAEAALATARAGGYGNVERTARSVLERLGT